MSDLHAHFLNDLEKYWHCEVRDASSGSDLLQALNHPSHTISEQEFREILAKAIERCSIGISEYEAVTGLDFDSANDVVEDLKALWTMMYGFVARN